MKGKLKLIILSMLALFLVACGSATPSPDGGGTIPKPVALVKWESIGGEIKSEVKKAKKGAIEVSLSEKDYEEDDIPSLNIRENAIVEYNEGQVKDIVLDPAKIRLCLNENSHLEFEGNVGEIKFEKIYNYGNMYFVDKLDKPKEYVVTLSKEDGIQIHFFENNGNIYVMDGNGGSTLKIDGDYAAYLTEGNIHLGLYVSKDGTKFSTDKVHITGVAYDKTKVHFIFNEGQVKGLQENARYHGEDYVIKVDGVVTKGKDAFEMEGSFPVGLNSYKLKFEHKGGDPGTEGHIWKLKLEEKK